LRLNYLLLKIDILLNYTSILQILSIIKLFFFKMNKFPTSDEVYDRIKTDPLIQQHYAIVTYYDALRDKHLDVPISSWKPIKAGGDIPWHRVWYFKYKGNIIWDRVAKLYTLNDVREEPDYLPTAFKVISYNILSDEFLKKINDVMKRKDKILEYIISTNADVICLQEVNEIMITELRKISGYNIIRTELEKNNIIIMTKNKIIESLIIEFNYAKHGIKFKLLNEDNLLISFIVVHLTSDSQSGAEFKRRTQLAKVLSFIDPSETTFIIGDFNCNHDTIPLFDNYFDSWNINKFDGYTYDPKKNKLADLNSANKNSQRLDRILYTGQVRTLKSVIRSDILSSDHFPLESIFEYDITIEMKAIKETSMETALTIIIPNHLRKNINYIRDKYDPVSDKWMPHVNIFFGFVPYDDFDIAYEKIKPLVNEYLGIEIILNKMNILDHDETKTLCLFPSDDSEILLRELRNRIREILVLPNDRFQPHLSLGKFSDDGYKKYLNEPFSISFKLNGLYFTNKHDEPYIEIKRCINNTDLTKEQILSEIKLITKYDVYVGGSNIYSDDISNDLDLVIFGTIDKKEFFGEYKRAFCQNGMFTRVEIIRNQYIGYFKLLTINGINIDLHYCKKKEDTIPFDIPEGLGFAITMVEPEDATSASVLFEGRMIVESMISIGKFDEFKKILSIIKSQFKKMEIYGQTFGYVTGITLAIMVGFLLHKKNIIDDPIKEFCDFYVEWKYPKPISFKNIACHKQESDKIMQVNRLSQPKTNTMRNVTKSSFKTIFDCMKCYFTLRPALEHKITFTISSYNEDYIDSIIKYFNQTAIKLMLYYQRNLAYVIPDNEWKINKNNDTLYLNTKSYIFNATWSLQTQKTPSGFTEPLCDIVERINKLFPNQIVTFEYK
jgi:poly(A) polymerase